MLKSNKVDLSPKARQALEIEAAFRRMTLRDLASELILEHISDRTLRAISDEGTNITTAATSIDADSKTKRRRLADDPDAMNKIKELWGRDPRPALSAIAKEVGWPKATIHDNIQKQIKAGLLPP